MSIWKSRVNKLTQKFLINRKDNFSYICRRSCIAWWEWVCGVTPLMLRNQHQIERGLVFLSWLFAVGSQSLDAHWKVENTSPSVVCLKGTEAAIPKILHKVNESSVREDYQEICSWIELKHQSRCTFDLVVQYHAYLHQKLRGKEGLLHVLCASPLCCYQPALPICSFPAVKLLEEP